MTEENENNGRHVFDLKHGTYEVIDGSEVVGRQELGFHGVSILYMNYHGVGNYSIRKVD